MPDTGYLAAAVGLCFAITWLLRALPFVILAPLRDSAVVANLGAHMPVGVMAILVIYTLRDVPQATAPHVLAVAAGLAATIALHLWRHNAMLSILAGTVVHVVLLNAF